MPDPVTQVVNSYAAGPNTKLFMGTSTAPATAVSGIKSFESLPALTSEEIDVTQLDQTDSAGNFDPIRQSAPGMADPGSLKCTLALNADQLAALSAVFQVKQYWKVLYSNKDYEVFAGWLKVVGKEHKGDKGEVLVPIEVRATWKSNYTKYVAPGGGGGG